MWKPHSKLGSLIDTHRNTSVPRVSVGISSIYCILYISTNVFLLYVALPKGFLLEIATWLHHKSTRTVNGIWRRCSVCKHTHTHVHLCIYMFIHVYAPTLYGRVIPKIHTLIALQRPDKAKCYTQHLHTHTHTVPHSLLIINSFMSRSIVRCT